MKLYKHQQEIIDDDPHYSGIFLGTGSGKTVTVLHLAEGRTLVICPKQQRDDETWQKNAKKAGLDVDLTVMSKEEFRRDWEKLPAFDTVISDESHEGILGVTPSVIYRNRKPIPKTSQLFDRFRIFLNTTKPKRLYLVTATPTRSPMAVWAAGVLLKHWSFDSFYRFRDRFYVELPITGRKIFVPRKTQKDKNKIGKLVQRLGYTGRLEDYFDVPDQTYRTDKIGLTHLQTEMLKDIPLMFPDPLVGVQKEYQVENGFLIDDDEISEYGEKHTDKILEYYEEFGKVFVVVLYTHQIKSLEKKLLKRKINTFVLTGKTKERKKLMEDAEKCESGIVIAQAQITSGYELPSYPVTIFASVSHRIVDYIQAQGRTQRANAIKKNLYVYFVTGDQSAARLDSLQNKKDFHEATYAKEKYELQKN